MASDCLLIDVKPVRAATFILPAMFDAKIVIKSNDVID